MTTRIVDFHPAHCFGATAHPSQAQYQTMLTDPSCFRWLWPDTLSALDGDELIAMGGTTRKPRTKLVEGALGAWVLFTDKITPARFLCVHRMVVRHLVVFEQIGEPIFVHADPNNPNAARWAGLLGMGTRRTDVLPDGRSMMRFESHVH